MFLPAEMTPLIGREADLQTLASLIQSHTVRLLTFTGPGGVGKTRLAISLARLINEQSIQKAFLVPLADLHDPQHLFAEIAEALGYSGSPHVPIQNIIADRELLIVLDGFDQIVTAATQLTTLLASCPKIIVFVTSRESLRIEGEYEWRVEPLPLPDQACHQTEQELSKIPSLALLLERTKAILPHFSLTETNRQPLVEICCRLDGLPLALELAAARLKLLSPRALRDRLEQPLALLTTGRRDAPVRHQSLRTAIKWGYDLLSTEEQQLFRRLCIFAGSCTIQALEGLVSNLGGDPASVLDLLDSLHNKSLIQGLSQDNGTDPRIQILATIRDFGLEYLRASDEWEAVNHAHALYYVEWAESGRRFLFSPLLPHYVQQYPLERENLHACMHWLHIRDEKILSLRLGAALGPFWLSWYELYDARYLQEGRDFLQQALQGSKQIASGDRICCLSMYGFILSVLEDEDGVVWCREAIALCKDEKQRPAHILVLWMWVQIFLHQSDYRAAHQIALEAANISRLPLPGQTIFGQGWPLIHSLYLAGRLSVWVGNYADACMFLNENITLCEQHGDLYTLARSRLLLGIANACQGKTDARTLLEESKRIFQMLHLKRGLAQALRYSGQLALFQNQFEEAETLFQQSLQAGQEMGDIQEMCWSQLWLARLNLELGHLDQSQVILEGMLTHALRMRYLALMAFGFSLLGAIVLARHDYPWAARLFGAALALREKTGIPIPAIEQGQYEHWVSRTQDALGGANFYSAWIEGYHLSPEQVLSNQSVSQRLLSDHAQPTGPEQLLTDLTQREIEVFRLLTEGLSNAEIARRLMLATVTISSYLRSIYTKLGVTSRTQAMRYAIDHQVFQHNQKEV